MWTEGDGIRGVVPRRGTGVRALWAAVGHGTRQPTLGATMALLILIGICGFALFVARGAGARAAPEQPGEPVGPVPELPPMPSPAVIPDTVPTAWIDAYGSDGAA